MIISSRISLLILLLILSSWLSGYITSNEVFSVSQDEIVDTRLLNFEANDDPDTHELTVQAVNTIYEFAYPTYLFDSLVTHFVLFSEARAPPAA